MFITKLLLENFKSFPSISLPLSTINILIGPNSSGKSSILQSLLILKNSLNQSPNQQGLKLISDSYDFGNFEDLVTFGDDSKELLIHIVGSKTIPKGFDEYATSVKFGYRTVQTKEGTSEVYLATTIDNIETIFDWRVKDNAPPKTKLHGYKDPTFRLEGRIDGLNARITATSTTSKNKKENLIRNLNNIFQNGDFTKHLLDDFHYIPYYRAATKYGVKLIGVPDDLLSSKPEEIISATLSKLSKNTKLLEQVSAFIKELTGKTIRTRNIDLYDNQNSQGVTLEFIKNGFANAISNEGTGSNQAILLLCIVAGTPQGSVIAIDEPEIHLHPSAQTKLARILLDVAKNDNKQIIFTTHSEHMIYPFLADIASDSENSFGTHNVKVYYFQPHETEAISSIDEIPINEHGQLEGGLKGFYESDLKVLGEFLKKNE